MNKQKAAGAGVGIVLAALGIWALLRPKPAAAFVGPPPGPDPQWPPQPAPPPAAGSLPAAIAAAAQAVGLAPWLALATAQVESGVARLTPNEPDACGFTHYPMGIKACTVATVMGRDQEWIRGETAKWEAMSEDLAVQIPAAIGLLKTDYMTARNLVTAAGRQAGEADVLNLVRMKYQAGNWNNGRAWANGGQLPSWYTAPYAGTGLSEMQRWLRAIAQWGGPSFVA